MILRAAVLDLGKLIPEPDKLAEIGVRLGLTVLAAFAAISVARLVVARVERLIARADPENPSAEQRARTLGQILRNLAIWTIAGVALIHALGILGYDIRPLLAGVGVLGVALGFGAQSLVRDMIAGIMILAENQYSVGDLIEINGKAANVEAVTLRCTTLRDFNGFVHFVPNGEMKVVTNRSRGWNRQAVDVVVASDQDLDRALEVCHRVVAAFNRDPAWSGRLLDPVDVWGIEGLGAAEAQIRMVVRAKPGPDGPEATRELRRRVHRALAEASIRSAPAREVLVGPGLAGRPEVPPPG